MHIYIYKYICVYIHIYIYLYLFIYCIQFYMKYILCLLNSPCCFSDINDQSTFRLSLAHAHVYAAPRLSGILLRSDSQHQKCVPLLKSMRAKPGCCEPGCLTTECNQDHTGKLSIYQHVHWISLDYKQFRCILVYLSHRSKNTVGRYVGRDECDPTTSTEVNYDWGTQQLKSIGQELSK